MLFTQSPGAWRRWLGCIALAGLPLLAAAQSQDPPDRVLYISAQQGAARLSTDGAQWSAAGLNWPVVTGAQLSTDPGAHLELDGGNVVIRIAGPSDLGVTQLNDQTTQLSLTDGSLSLRVRGLQPGERVEIDTPQLAVVADQAGDYRIDVDPRSDSSRVSVLAGMATVYGEAGQVTNIGGPQMMAFAGRGLSVIARGGLPARDGFDQWIVARENQWRNSASARYVSPAMPGVGLLDQYGEWGQDPTYGAVWYPQVSTGDWAPYRYGRWSWVEPWGWTWVDDAPWGFAPSHYGRWAQIGTRWAWVPGPRIPRPVYAPALVGFVGAVGSAGWGISVGSALPGAAWFPLAPGEVWQPHYRVSGAYMQRLNPWINGRAPLRAPDSYYFQRRPTAVSFAPPDRFGGRGPEHGPRFADGTRLPPGALDGARPIAPPPRGFAPGRGVLPAVPAPSNRPTPDMRPPVVGHGPAPHMPGLNGAVSAPALPPGVGAPGLPRPGRPDEPFHNRAPAAPITPGLAQPAPRGPLPPPNAELPRAPVYPTHPGNPGQVAPPAMPPHGEPRPDPRGPQGERPRPQAETPPTRPMPNQPPQTAPMPPTERPARPPIERPARPPMEQPAPHMPPPQRMEPPQQPMPQHRPPQAMPQPQPQPQMRPQPMPHGQMEGPRMPPPQREMREPPQRPQPQAHERPPQREGRPQREER